MPTFKPLKHHQFIKCIVTLQFNVWSISKEKPNLDYIYVIHLVPNNTQMMHTRLQVKRVGRIYTYQMLTVLQPTDKS